MNKYLKSFIIALHAFILWILCGATIGIGRALAGIEITLIIHLIGAPVFAFLVSFVYHGKFNYTKPIITAIIFLLFIVAMDLFVAAMLIEKSFAMFKSIIGTWLPFVLIFTSTFLTGLFVNKYKK